MDSEKSNEKVRADDEWRGEVLTEWEINFIKKAQKRAKKHPYDPNRFQN